MENIKTRVESFKRVVESYGKLKNSIKKNISEKLGETVRYLEMGPGVVSPERVSKYLSDVKSLIGVWVRDSEILKDWYSEVEEIRNVLFPCTSQPTELNTFLKEDKKVEFDKRMEKRDLSIKTGDAIKSMEESRAELPEINRKYRSLFPEKLEKLDVCYLPIGVIPHYCIVYKVAGPITFVLSLTSNKKEEFFGHVIKRSRFFKNSTAVFALNQIPTDLAMSMYVMPFDSKSEGNLIIRECTEYLNKTVLAKLKKRK